MKQGMDQRQATRSVSRWSDLQALPQDTPTGGKKKKEKKNTEYSPNPAIQNPLRIHTVITNFTKTKVPSAPKEGLQES